MGCLSHIAQPEAGSGMYDHRPRKQHQRHQVQIFRSRHRKLPQRGLKHPNHSPGTQTAVMKNARRAFSPSKSSTPIPAEVVLSP